MKVHFVTPTRISLINLTTIGDSEKREDDTKIGKFSSGQAYATALLLRDGVNMSISVFGGEDSFESQCKTESYTETITYSTKNRICDSTNKSKEVITLNYEKAYNGSCNSIHDFYEPREGESFEIETAFALQLGYNWEIWMAYRELMSNVLDEGGYVTEQDYAPEPKEGTVITLEFDESNTFFEVWQNKNRYMNFEEPLYKLSNSVEVLSNEEGYLRIYKQNILVYQNKEKPSRFAYNIKFGEIDERRILNNIYDVEQVISSHIMSTENEEYLREIIKPTFEVKDNEFLSSNYRSWCTISDLINRIVTEVYEQHGQVDSYKWIIEQVKKRKDCKIGGKKITTVEDSLWSYSKTVTVDSLPQTISEPSIKVENEIYISPLQNEVNKLYNFTIDVEVKQSKLTGSKVVADKYEKCLIIDETFSVEQDFPEFLVEYIDLTQKGNVVKNLALKICELIKK